MIFKSFFDVSGRNFYKRLGSVPFALVPALVLTWHHVKIVTGQTIVGGARVVSGAEKKNHLIEAAPFGRLDQMLQTTV